ncbi:hypothetical protein I230019B6_13650 [Firmicutes bacterium i23-0019-B6]
MTPKIVEKVIMTEKNYFDVPIEVVILILVIGIIIFFFLHTRRKK